MEPTSEPERVPAKLNWLIAKFRCLGVVDVSEEPGPTPVVMGDVRTVVKTRNAKITTATATRVRQLAIRLLCSFLPTAPPNHRALSFGPTQL